MTKPIELRAVVFREGDAWVVQCIEYDIAAHAATITDLEHAFMRAVFENCIITEHLGRKPLEGIKPAPDRFRHMYEEAQHEITPVGPVKRRAEKPTRNLKPRLRFVEPVQAA